MTITKGKDRRVEAFLDGKNNQWVVIKEHTRYLRSGYTKHNWERIGIAVTKAELAEIAGEFLDGEGAKP